MKLAGLPVIDAKHGLKLEISYRDTIGGRKDPWKCAAAKCLLRCLQTSNNQAPSDTGLSSTLQSSVKPLN